MTTKWKEEYKNLGRFIASNSEIKITPSVTRIPQELRSEYFYLFEKVRTSFVLERHSENLQKANLLKTRYQEEKELLLSELELDKIFQDSPLELFLNDPLTRCIHDIHAPGLELLKGLIDEDDFEERCDFKLAEDFYNLYSAGYNRWVILALSRLLGPDTYHKVVLEEATDEEVFGDVGFVGRYVPAPKISSSMTFDRPVEIKFIIPDVIIHSSLADSYVALRSEVKKALVVATNRSEEFEWLEGNSIGDIEPNVILLYSCSNRENLRLVSDKTSIAKPNLIVQTLAIPEDYNPEKFQQTHRLHEKLCPPMGTFLVFNGDIPSFVTSALQTQEAPACEPENSRQEPCIQALSIGFDKDRLQPVLSKLAASDEEKSQTENKTDPSAET